MLLFLSPDLVCLHWLLLLAFLQYTETAVSSIATSFSATYLQIATLVNITFAATVHATFPKSRPCLLTLATIISILAIYCFFNIVFAVTLTKNEFIGEIILVFTF